MNRINFKGHTFTPSKIVCVGRNYVDHAKELGNAVPADIVLFVKPNSAISIELKSFLGEPLHYEAEISFLIKGSQLYAIGLGIDVTKRGLQNTLKNAGLPWEKSKAFDGAAVFGEFVPLPESVDDLEMELKINGEVKQWGNVQQMLFKPSIILEECLSFMSLNDGDIIMTGTPGGVGKIQKGDIFEGKISDGYDIIVGSMWVAE